MTTYQRPVETNESISLKLRNSQPEELVWYKIIQEGRTLYIRLAKVDPDADKKVIELLHERSQKERMLLSLMNRVLLSTIIHLNN